MPVNTNIHSTQLYTDEIHVNATLVGQLIAEQFPEWRGFPLESVHSAGTDNTLYRLGKSLVVRLPRRPGAALQLQKECQWLPFLAPYIPLTIPIPLAQGLPSEAYPYNWSVYQWIEGHNAIDEAPSNMQQTAITLARFITALQHVDATGGPTPGEHNFYRGVPLNVRDTETRAAIQSLSGRIDTGVATEIWEQALNAAPWEAPPVWLHGDIHAGNLLVRNGLLNAIIDFGGLGVGDPACDLMVAWNFLDANGRKCFNAELSSAGSPLCNKAAWLRGRGWALSMAVIALPYYLHTGSILVGIAQRTLEAVLESFKGRETVGF